MEASDRASAPKAAAASAALAAAAEGRTLATSTPAADFGGGGDLGGGGPSPPAAQPRSRRAALDDPALDLTASLLAARPPLVPGAVPVGRGGGRAAEGTGTAAARAAALASAGRPARPAWGPDGRLASAPPPPSPARAPWAGADDTAARVVAAAAEAAAFEEMKGGMMAWTVSAGLAGTALAALFYPPDAALSYALGAAGGAVYLNLLNRSVDGLGGGGGGGGPPRLLVPVILAAGSNRWNTLAGTAAGGPLDLLLLPMLVGFFTYKVAVVGKQGLAVLGDLSREAGAGKK